MEVGAEDLFTGRARVYHKARPRYPVAFLDSLGLDETSIVADMGAGTGILTKELLDRNATVYAVEPNEDMLEVLESELEKYPACKPVHAFAEQTGLPDGAVNLVLAAQAFHWFEPEEFKAECIRILGGEGRVILAWNTYRAEDKIVLAQKELQAKFCPRFRGFSGGLDKDRAVKRFFNNSYEKHVFPNDISFDVEGFINRCLSASHALTRDDKGFEEYFEALLIFFYTHQKNDRLLLPNDTVVYSGIVKG